MNYERLIQVIRTKLHFETIVSNGDLKFFCPTFLQMWRAETLYTKEPETIAWIDSFKPNSVLWDIGANVGVYSIYAASLGHRVVAFEPDWEFYSLLVENTRLNKLKGYVYPRQAALNEDTDYEHYRPDPNYIKIDTDGFEVPILLGLEKNRILAIAKEISIEVTPEDFDEILEILERNGYKFIKKEHAKMFDGGPYEKYDNAIFRREGLK